MKKALITGASSGIGMDMARLLAKKGVSLILVARREDRLINLSKELDVPCKVIKADLSNIDEVKKVCESNPDIDYLINNAGFGVFGEFTQTDFEREYEMINLNITALHYMMKFYLTRFKEKDRGKILNVASTAAFFPGPMFSSYYASKAYVLRLSRAVKEELRRAKSNVTISVLCPGPVRTEFNSVAGVKFGVGSISSKTAAEIGINAMLRGRICAVPSFPIKMTQLFSKIIPEEITARIVYKLQKAKKL